MAITPYLAMTAAEMGRISALPEKVAWMACHFSPYSTGISNLPDFLPEGSMLILNDITPIHGHDPERIGKQLAECVESNKSRNVLLDFQRFGCEETSGLVKYLVDTLSCPVGVSERYAAGLDCPVFLSPVPCHVPLREHIAPWKGRDIWLEIGLAGECLKLTEAGCDISCLSNGGSIEDGQKEEDLHCHYHIELSEHEAQFTLWRSKDDLRKLLEEAEAFDIDTAVGLWQELNWQESHRPDARL